MQNRSVLGANPHTIFVVTIAALAAGCDDDGENESHGGEGRKPADGWSTRIYPLDPDELRD